MTVLLALDLLGLDARWRAGQPAEAEALSLDFADLVLDTMGSLDVAEMLRGEIVQERAALLCPSIESALALARRIFRRAWLDPRTPDEMRLWMRGAILPCDDASPSTTEADEELAAIRRTVAGPCLQRAMAGLRSGLAGMRILVDDRLLNDQLRGVFRVPLGRLGFIPFRRMNQTPYPQALARNFQDFLWMADTAPEWHTYTVRMKQRMLWTAQDAEEFAEAAATQTLFHEVDAILQSVVRKNSMQAPDDRGPRARPRGEHEHGEASRGSDAEQAAE
jgi:hypothetical protein